MNAHARSTGRTRPKSPVEGPRVYHAESIVTPQLEPMQSEETDVDLQKLQARIQDLEAKRDQVLEPRLDDTTDDVESLVQRVAELEDTVRVLESRLDSIGELAPDKVSDPETKMRDLRALMLNKARADYEGSGDGQISWTYRQVIDALESNGHGTVYPAQAYDAMSDAAEVPWFGEGENLDGQQVIRVDWTETPASDTVNDVNNASGVSRPGTVSMTD